MERRTYYSARNSFTEYFDAVEELHAPSTSPALRQTDDMPRTKNDVLSALGSVFRLPEYDVPAYEEYVSGLCITHEHRACLHEHDGPVCECDCHLP
jgi:hypothetical protein